MRTRHWTATAVAALAIAGAAAVPATAVDSTPAAGGSVNAADTAFLKSAHQGNLAEIAAGEDAVKHATTSCVMRTGRTLVTDHTKLDGDVKRVADKVGVSLPNAPTPEQQKELAEVQGKAGSKAYDEAWLKVQVAAHEKTLGLIDRELKEGRNAEVKATAKAARPVVSTHLAMVRDGKCQDHAPAAKVPAGDGGQMATSLNTSVDTGIGTRPGVAAAVLAGGALLLGSGTVLLIRSRRTATGSARAR
ncbi:DUF4142 domain-containing protein [Streptomyces sp. URMC 123]|uniref:DUF4142 domain-containing protein n=1 Tax=Streptomyces sp. URMC 123 TaxID=3423403 RepID=UPI003F1CA7E4